jgi:lactoylglutathione lyase
MKQTAFILLLVMAMTKAGAQQPVLNHIAVYVQDLDRSTRFYHEVIGLDTIPEPFHDGKHTWFSVGGNAHLHVISGAGNPIAHDKNSHLCFSVASVPVFLERLKKAGVGYEDWPGKPQSITTRVDGVHQVYFKDPDGWWIEVNDAK